MPGGESSLEQRLRDRDANNRLVTERDSLKEQLKEVQLPSSQTEHALALWSIY